MDYWRLNGATKFDAYPMLRIDKMVDKIRQSQYLNMLDLAKGYWQVPMKEAVKEKTAFSSH